MVLLHPCQSGRLCENLVNGSPRERTASDDDLIKCQSPAAQNMQELYRVTENRRDTSVLVSAVLILLF